MTAQTDHRRKHRGGCRSAFATLVACVAAFFASASSALGQCQYEVTAIIDIRNCDIGGSSTFAQAMNNNAEVVGFYRFCAIGNDRAYFWSLDDGFITLPHPPGVVRSWAYDINDHGLIVGQQEFTGIGRKGFVYDMKTGEYQHLEPLHDGVSAVNVSSANAINNAGVVAGMRSISKTGGTPHNAVIWDTNTGEVTDLGVMNGPNSASIDISETGTVVGWTGNSSLSIGFSRDNSGRVVLIDPPSGADTSSTSAVNNDGYVVGTAVTFSVPSSRAYLWHPETGLTMIDPLPGFTSSQGKDVNSFGQVLMRSSTSASNIVSSLWQHGSQHQLQDLLTPDSGVVLGIPKSINEAGQILVQIGSTLAGLLTPVDVPLADLNYDCKVDLHDLMILLNQWGPIGRGAAAGQTQTSTPSADLNRDGVVDVLDLFILLANWG